MSPKICLAMIVKNEARTIHLALNSSLWHVDAWVIADTGSTDDTSKRILDITTSHPTHVGGKLLNHKWIDFSTNRNMVLDEIDRMGFDYAFIIDADDELVAKQSKIFHRQLTEDYHDILYRHGRTTFTRSSLIRCNRGIRFINPVHEIVMIDPRRHASGGTLSDCYVKYNKCGNRSRDPDVLRKDLVLLHQGISAVPNNLRLRYHLANTYNSLGNTTQALREYQQLISLATSGISTLGDANGYDLWTALIQMSNIRDSTGIFSMSDIIDPLMQAYDMKPWRAEPLALASGVCARHNLYHRAFMYSSMTIGISRPNDPRDQVMVDEDGYRWGFMFDHVMNAIKLKMFDLAREMLNEFLSLDAPEEMKESLSIALSKCYHANATDDYHVQRSCVSGQVSE